MPGHESQSLDSPSSEKALSDEDGKFLWSNILKEVTHKASFKLPDTRALIVLGDDECGKTTLVTRLQGTEDPKKSFGLEYILIDVKDEDRDDQTKLNVWILDGGVTHSRLLKFALNAENFGECMIMMVVSMAEPWNIVGSLEKWVDLLKKHITKIDVPLETITEYKAGLKQQFRDYVEPDALLPPSTPAPVSHAPLTTAPINLRRPTHSLHPAVLASLSASLGDVKPKESQNAVEPEQQTTVTELPLDESTLSENLGLPIVVVVTKTDVMNTLEKEERFTEEHFDFIQMHIRRFCLKYGAALFYVSVKDDKHCDLLNRYLQSRIYGFPFTHAPYVVERDCVFVPTGWDSEKKIAILEENITQVRSADDYNSVIPRPSPHKAAVREGEVNAQDEQAFLTKLIAVMQREVPGTAAPGSGTTEGLLDQMSVQAGGSPSLGQRPLSGSPRTPPTGSRTKAPAPQVAGPNSGGPGATSRASEGVLANFFTSLLNKKSSVGGTPPTGLPVANQPADKLGMSPKDIQSELERLARGSREALEAIKPQSPKRPSDATAAESTSPVGLVTTPVERELAPSDPVKQ